MKSDALVGYGWCRASYVALRSLHRLGLRVAVADEYGVGMALWSRFAVQRFIHPDYRNHAEAFVDAVVGILKETGARFYLPGHDEGEVVARCRDRFPSDVIIPLHTHDKLALANNKAETARVAQSIGIPIPTTFSYERPEALLAALKDGDAGNGFVIKLLRGTSAKGVLYGRTAVETEAAVRKLIAQYGLSIDRYPLVQQRVPGEGWGVSCLYWQGRRVASFTHRRLREKIVSGGTSTLRESADNPVIEEYAHRLLDHLQWHGLAMVEFKWDQATRRGWLIEINPRLWGSIALPVACGVDFPALTYIAAMRGPDEAAKLVKPVRAGVAARWYMGDLIRGVGRFAAGHPIEALRCMIPGHADVYDDLPFDDPGALVGQYVFYLTRFLKARSLNPTDESLLG